MRTRGIEEQVKDMLLELFLLDNASSYDEMRSRMKVQKLHFLCQKQMTEDQIKGIDLVFFTYKRGPFSKLLANDLRALQRLGLIMGDHQLTDRGKEVLAQHREAFKRQANDIVVDQILSTLKQYGHLSAEELEEITHDILIEPAGSWLSESVRIRDLSPHTDLLVPLDATESRAAFELTEDELESLQLTFCWTQEDLRDMRLSSSRSYEELFDGV